MKVKPKEAFLNLPIVLSFDDEDGSPAFASNINTILHGKIKVKYDSLGILGEKYMSIFYLQRNDEYHDLRDSFIQLIEREEMGR